MTTTGQGRVLIVDNEPIAVKSLGPALKEAGYTVKVAPTWLQGLAILRQEPCDVVLTDLCLEQTDGVRVLQESRQLYPESEVIIMTRYATLEHAVAAMKLGAFHYFAKPFLLDEVCKVVAAAMDKVRLKQENRQLRETLEQAGGGQRIITQNGVMRRLLAFTTQIATTDCNLLITGESGTGKELFARYLHEASRRARGAFVAINCGAFNAELLENELFGHGRGAFTGAVADKKGLIEAAHGGTLFLDEITETSAAMQVKLLRVIQEQEVLRIGETTPIKVDVRFMGATNRDLHEEMRKGRLRQDLFYRMNVATVAIPPLAQRKDDILLLSHHFLRQFAARYDKPVNGLTLEAQEVLQNYDYPGNVRELRNIIERGVALATGELIEAHHLPDDLRHLAIRAFRRKDGQLPTLEEREREYIFWVMRETQGNQTVAAQILGIDRVSLWRKLKRFQLEDS